MAREDNFCQDNTVPSALPFCIHEIFHQQALERPDAPAVHAWDGKLTYRELDEKSTALAMTLRRRGVQQNVFVALCFDRSLWTTVAMLAVSKAGGVWFFLEPTHPVNRLRDICNCANANILLSGASRLELAAQLSGCQIETLIVTEAALDFELELELELEDVGPDQPAYVAFTSGSTGKPKGALMSHQAAVAGVLYNHKPMQLSKDSRVLHFASYSFDISFLEHFWSLLLGGCLCIPSEADRQSNLMHAVQELQVNWTFLTPTVARLLEPAKLPSLRTLCLGGEPVTQGDLDMWLPYVHLSGLYGPAECAVGIAVQPDYSQVNSAANLGPPYAVACWIVDENDPNSLATSGAVGELVVEGPSISECYINDPKQTAKAYLSNPPWLPASRHSRKKLYRTGDLVRYLPDGSLYFLCRKDTQVKINGQRIELGEIEYHVRDVLSSGSSHPQIIVEAIMANRRSMSVVAFYVQDQGPQSFDDVELFLSPDEQFASRKETYKSQIRERLPHYMVPETFVPIRRIPLTTSGKSDRKRLREQFLQLPLAQIKTYFLNNVANEQKEMPTTELEKQMQAMWAQVLKLEGDEVGRHDSWISLGGDSLAAMRLLPLARKARIRFTVPDIFRHKTIGTLCQHVSINALETADKVQPFALLQDRRLTAEGIRKIAAEQCRVSCDSIEDAYPFTALQDATVLPPIQLGYNYTLRLEFKLEPRINLDRLVQAWEMTFAFNPVLRMRIVRLPNDELVQVVTREKIPMEVLTRANATRYEPGVDLWGLGEPLVRAGVQEKRLVVLVQHALYDGHSLGLIFRDLAHAYHDQNLELTQYAPFVRWSTDLTAPKRQYWKDKFVGFDGRVFPPKVDNPSLEYLESRHLWGHIDLVQDAYTATNKIRVALAILFYWYFDTIDVVIGVVFARRAAPLPGILDAPIPTSCILPDRIRLDLSQPLRVNLERDQENVLSMMPYEGIRPCQVSNLSVECQTAGQYQSILAVQPDSTTTYPKMFRDHKMGYYGPVAAWNFMLQCYLGQGSARVSLRLSERTIKESVDWERFLTQFEAVIHFIQKDPELKIADLQSQLGV
jgi:amino acid adenylation domain-containing protein